MVVNIDTYNQLLQNPKMLTTEHISDLKSLIYKYPYFQSARALYLKGLKNADSFRYNFELKVTAAHTTDRAVLFDFITSDTFLQKTETSKKEKESEEEDVYTNPEESILQVGKPIEFKTAEKYSFNQWLQLSVHKPILRSQETSTQEYQKNIIDKFIESNPKIIPVEKDQKLEVSISKNKPDKSLMTETLAKVYLEQKKYSNAIKAYEILSLKYPEKSGFFADQIKRIKLLKIKKS